MAVAEAGLAGAEVALVGSAPPVSRGALAAMLARVALGTSARLHPARRSPGATARSHQRDVIQVAGAWKRKFKRVVRIS